jgi:RNA polymerase sigma factor (sigma-70 family)
MAAWGDLSLPFDRYARGVIAGAQARLVRLALPLDPRTLARALATLALADLYLAIACEAGIGLAWEKIARELMPRLDALARSRGLNEAEAHEVLGDLPGYLALPAPSGNARTRLGTYEGSCGLFSWLAVFFHRRWVDRNRARARIPGATSAGIEESALVAERDPAAGPLAAVENRERAERLRKALGRGFAQLSPREACAMRFKYVSGLQQREIAGLLGVKEPRISTLVKQATEKLRAALASSLGDESPARGPQDENVWASLRDALGVQMEIPTNSADLPRRPS